MCGWILYGSLVKRITASSTLQVLLAIETFSMCVQDLQLWSSGSVSHTPMFETLKPSPVASALKKVLCSMAPSSCLHQTQSQDSKTSQLIAALQYSKPRQVYDCLGKLNSNCICINRDSFELCPVLHHKVCTKLPYQTLVMCPSLCSNALK